MPICFALTLPAQVKPTRLSALLNAGLGYVADAKASAGFIDFDAGGCLLV